MFPSKHYLPSSHVFLNVYLFIFNYILYSILFCISFRCATQWLDSHILYKVVPQIFQELIMHCTQFLHYWLHSSCCTSNPFDCLTILWLPIGTHYCHIFHSSPQPPPVWSLQLRVSFHFCLFILLFRFHI